MSCALHLQARTNFLPIAVPAHHIPVSLAYPCLAFQLGNLLQCLMSFLHTRTITGGRMAFTFLAAQGVAVGRTQIEEAWLEVGRVG